MASSSSSSFASYSSLISHLLLYLFLLLQAAHVASPTLIAGLRSHDPQKRAPVFHTNGTTCNLFTGSWVVDYSYPLYRSSSCSLIDPEFNCQMFGRPDSNYQRYKWKPLNCELPKFDAIYFLSRMRGKTVMFVGDSLGLNQWESLICMLSSAVLPSETQLIRRDPLSTFKFMGYDLSISFYRAPYLVDIDLARGKRILRLDDMTKNGKAWRGVDVLSFNTGHWWSHQGGLQGWDYMELGGAYFADMDRIAAFERGMRTWAKWVDMNVDTTKTRVFFQSISPTHYNPSEWSSPASKNCYRETAPIHGWAYSGSYPEQMRVVKSAITQMANPAYLLDITTLSELRKDGHPSIYSGDLSAAQRAHPDRSADCSHWCLPGLPDTWNHLFYTALLF